MNKLDHGYTAEVDKIGRDEWSQLLHNFDDANIFQTWAYGSVHWGEKNLSHLVLKKDGQNVAAAQIWRANLAVIGGGFAHISWGPMWRLRGRKLDLEVVRNMIRALQGEYIIRRHLLLRIRSNEIDDNINGESVRQIFEAENLKRLRKEGRYCTILLNLAPELKEIRKNLRSSWRRHLNRAERQDLKVTEGTDDEMFHAFSEIYHDMVSRKGFTRYIANMKQYAVIQKQLPKDLKMKIFLCQFQGEFVGGIVVPVFGNTAAHIFSATSTKGLKSKLDAAYLLQWRVIERLKEEGFQYYDLRGYSPDEYPGVSSFKAGLSGDVVHFLGSFESGSNLVSLLFVRTAELLDHMYQNSRRVIPNKVQIAFHRKSKYLHKDEGHD